MTSSTHKSYNHTYKKVATALKIHSKAPKENDRARNLAYACDEIVKASLKSGDIDTARKFANHATDIRKPSGSIWIKLIKA